MHVTSSYTHMIMNEINTCVTDRKNGRYQLSIKDISKSVMIDQISKIYPTEVNREYLC